MALDPNGPLTQYRAQIDQNTLDIEDRATKTQVLDNFVSAGYGGIGLDGPVVMPDVSGTWVTLEGWTLQLVANPVNVIQNFAASGLQIEDVGIYNINVKVALSFAESNGSREISLRIYNQSQATPTSTTFDYFVGRNQGGVNMSFAVLAEVQAADLNDLFVIQVNSADSFTTVANVGSIFQMFHVSEYQGTL